MRTSLVVTACLAGVLWGAGIAWALPSFIEVRTQVKEYPDDLKSRYLLGKYYLKMGQFEDCLSQWIYIVNKRPKLWKMYDRIGLVRYRMGGKSNTKKAAKIWQYVLVNSPDDAFATKALKAARAKIDEDVWSNTTAATATTTPSTPIQTPSVAGKPEDAFEEGWRLYCQEDWGPAGKKFEEVALSPYKKRETLLYLGNCYLKDAERPEKAIECFQKRLTDFGEDAEVLFAMGSAHGLRGEFDKQIECYEKSLQFDPDNAETHFQLALAYDKVDKPNKTVEHAQKAVQIDASFKKRLQPLIKNSKVARRIGSIITDVLRETENSQLSDEQIDEYAKRVGDILGEENINPDSAKQMMRDPRKIQAFKNFQTSGHGRDDIDKLSQEVGIKPEQIEAGIKKFQEGRKNRN